jgi:hypothetical protein
MAGFNPLQPRDNLGKWSEQNIPKYILDKIKKNVYPEKGKFKFEGNEGHAIDDYLGSDGPSVNKILREESWKEEDQTHKYYIKNIDNILNRSPKHQGETFRVLYFRNQGDADNLVRQFESGMFSDNAYMSTSVDKEWTFYAPKIKDDEGRIYRGGPATMLSKDWTVGGAFITVKGKSGVDVRPFAPLKENEVLFPRKTKFKSRITHKRQYGGRTFINVELTEI